MPDDAPKRASDLRLMHFTLAPGGLEQPRGLEGRPSAPLTRGTPPTPRLLYDKRPAVLASFPPSPPRLTTSASH